VGRNGRNGGDRAKRTLATRAAEQDAGRFLGRAHEVELFERALRGDEAASLLFVHAPAGIGKSALLREASRRAEMHGYLPVWLEGRELAPAPEALDAVVADVAEIDRLFLVLDSYERISGMGGYLRRAVLPLLSEQAIVAIGSRQPPEEGWYRAGWESLLREIELSPMDEQEAGRLVRRLGVSSREVAAELVEWAEGSPLALTLAVEAARSKRGWVPGGPKGSSLIRSLIRRLADREVTGQHFLTLAAAALARGVTRELLAAAIPEEDAEAEFVWLAEQSFVDGFGHGLALHELVRRAMLAELRSRHRELEQLLRRRLADYYYERARADEGRLASIDLAHLTDDPAIRWGFSWATGSRYRIDDVIPGDVDLLDRRLRGTRHEPVWSGSSRYLEEAPEHVSIIRDAADRVCGYGVALGAESAPHFAAEDPLLGPRLRHAREHCSGEAAVLWRDLVDLSQKPSSSVIGMLGLAGALRAETPNPRFAYLPINPRLPGAREFSAVLGGRHLVELDAEIGDQEIECHLVDYGPGGLWAAQREVIYRELGLAAPRRESAAGDVRDQVREALRSLKVPARLAENPLATGHTPAERAASVSALLEDAAHKAFGSDDANERLLQQVVLRGYLNPAATHELAAEELSLSRAAYFRRLRAGTERLAQYIATQAEKDPDKLSAAGAERR
jgi:hypothetical protein